MEKSMLLLPQRMQQLGPWRKEGSSYNGCHELLQVVHPYRKKDEHRLPLKLCLEQSSRFHIQKR